MFSSLEYYLTFSASLLITSYFFISRQAWSFALKTMSLDDLDAFFKTQIVGKQFDIGVIGNEKDINFKALSKFNTIKKLDVDYLFNF